jgi:hypothetical protein
MTDTTPDFTWRGDEKVMARMIVCTKAVGSAPAPVDDGIMIMGRHEGQSEPG